VFKTQGDKLQSHTSFLVRGLQVANMFIGPFAAMNQAKAGLWGFYLRNLLPVTVGNIVGGVVLCAGIQHLAYGNSFLNSKKKLA
jgi:formate/nitrite transporter FocA (FNT family)